MAHRRDHVLIDPPVVDPDALDDSGVFTAELVALSSVRIQRSPSRLK
jgi:hypothetical protein